MPDDDRNPELEAMVNQISDFIHAQINAYQAANDTRPQFLLITLDGDMMEFASEISDHDLLFDAMAELGAEWVEQGLVDPDDADAETPASRVQ